MARLVKDRAFKPVLADAFAYADTAPVWNTDQEGVTTRDGDDYRICVRTGSMGPHYAIELSREEMLRVVKTWLTEEHSAACEAERRKRERTNA